MNLTQFMKLHPLPMKHAAQGDVIPEGQRNSTLSRFVLCVLKKYGADDGKAQQAFAEESAKCSPPLDARELYRRLMSENLALSTIYRVLAAFEARGMVTKTAVPGSETAAYALSRGGHEHYALCLGCRRQFPLRTCPLEHVTLEEDAEGFRITGHRLELYGYCRDCQRAGRDEKE